MTHRIDAQCTGTSSPCSSLTAALAGGAVAGKPVVDPGSRHTGTQRQGQGQDRA